jgi:hypothetical protein
MAIRHIKAILFILIGAAIHFALCIAVFGAYMGCEGRTTCVPESAKIGGILLSFPMSLVSWIWQQHDMPLKNSAFYLAMLNSVLAVTIIWLLLKVTLLMNKSDKSGINDDE